MTIVQDYLRRYAPRQYAVNTVWMLADKCWALGLSLLATILIARHLGSAGFGVLQYAVSLCGLVELLATLGLDNILIRELVKQPEHAGRLLGTAATLKSCAVLCVVVVLGLSALVSGEDESPSWIAFVISLGLLPQALNVIDFLFQSRVDARWSALARALAVGCGVGFVLVGIRASKGVTYFAWQPVLQASLTGLVLWLCLRRLEGTRIRWSFDGQLARALLRESWPLTFAMGLVSIYSNVDRVMIKLLLGDEATGLYSAAVKLSDGWHFLPAIIVSSVFPALVRARQASPEQYQARLQNLYDAMVWLAVCVALPVGLSAEWIMATLYGESYRVAGAVLSVQVWGGVFVSLGIASGRWMVLEGMSRFYLSRTGLGVGINIASNLLLIPAYGIVGAAISTVLAQLAVVLVFDALWIDTRPSFRMKCRALLPLHWFLRV